MSKNDQPITSPTLWQALRDHNLPTKTREGRGGGCFLFVSKTEVGKATTPTEERNLLRFSAHV